MTSRINRWEKVSNAAICLASVATAYRVATEGSDWFGWSLLWVMVGIALMSTWFTYRLPRLWGAARGVPFCGHPFEQAYYAAMMERVSRDDPKFFPDRWQCPHCKWEFVVVDGHFEPAYRWVRPRVTVH